MKSFPPFGFGIATLTASVALVVAPSRADAELRAALAMSLRDHTDRADRDDADA